jgi:hypothetical protein
MPNVVTAPNMADPMPENYTLLGSFSQIAGASSHHSPIDSKLTATLS